ncbi:MAG: hypothetical protein KJZ97_03190 [Burkholderiaceae bacterium]|nr:hypothetical protein [Burkholderiaceae bacterium]
MTRVPDVPARVVSVLGELLAELCWRSHACPRCDGAGEPRVRWRARCARQRCCR